MTGARTPADRRARLVDAIVAARDDGGTVVFVGSDARVEYEDRRFRLELGADEADRLESFLASYPVFKYKQPETRKAPEDVVYVSAVTDPKHAADFLEELFREVYGADEDYELRIERGRH